MRHLANDNAGTKTGFRTEGTFTTRRHFSIATSKRQSVPAAMASKKQNSAPARSHRANGDPRPRPKQRGDNGSKHTLPTNGHWFSATASYVSHLAGKPIAFLLATGTILVWAVTGPIFHFSDTWQLVINTGTTIVTFLMVFLIQNTQNRDALAIQIKLSELIVAVKGAHNRLAALEGKSENELREIEEEIEKRAAHTGHSAQDVKRDTRRAEQRHGARASS